MTTEVLHIMYSIEKRAEDYDCIIITKIHGIFTGDEIRKLHEQRKKLDAKVMIVPLNKFVEEGVEL